MLEFCRRACFLPNGLSRRGALLASLLLLSAEASSAQTLPAADSASLPPCPPAGPARHRVGFVLSLDNRESFVQASAVHVVGVNAGVVLPDHRWRLGVGAYTLSRDYAKLYVYQYKNGKRTKKLPDTLTPQLSLSYLTPNISYVLVQRRWLEVSLPLELGLGRSHYTMTDQNGNTPTDSRGWFVPVEAGVAVLVKPCRWAGVSGSLGYRASVFEADYKEDFDGMYFSYRLNVFVGAIWRDWHQHQRARHFAREVAAARRAD